MEDGEEEEEEEEEEDEGEEEEEEGSGGEAAVYLARQTKRRRGRPLTNLERRIQVIEVSKEWTESGGRVEGDVYISNHL